MEYRYKDMFAGGSKVMSEEQMMEDIIHNLSWINQYIFNHQDSMKYSCFGEHDCLSEQCEGNQKEDYLCRVCKAVCSTNNENPLESCLFRILLTLEDIKKQGVMPQWLHGIYRDITKTLERRTEWKRKLEI